MKKLILSLFLSLTAMAAFAQDDDDSSQAGNAVKRNFYKTPYRSRNSGSYGKSFAQLSLSYGFPNYLYGASYYASGYYGNALGIGPVMLRFEKAVHDEIGVMVFAQAAAKRWTNGGYTENAFGVSFGALGVYHFNKLIPVRKLDVYAGVGAEVSHRTISDDYYNYDNSDTYFDFAGMVGARYLFSKHWSVFAEAGSTGYSYTNVGITLTFLSKHHNRSREEPKVSPGM